MQLHVHHDSWILSALLPRMNMLHGAVPSLVQDLVFAELHEANSSSVWGSLYCNSFPQSAGLNELEVAFVTIAKVSNDQ